MRHYIIKISGRKVAEVNDLSFLQSREHHYNWLQRHYYNIRYKRACKKADIVVAKSQKVADDIVRYYFIPRSKIIIRQKKGKKH